MQSKIKSSRSYITIVDMLSFLILGWMNGGLFHLIPFYNAYVLFGLFIVWLFFAIISDNKMISRIFLESGWLIALLLILLPSSLFIHGTIESKLLNLILIYIVHSIYLYYKNKSSKKIVKYILIFLIIDKIIIAIYTIYILNIYPELSRELASGLDKVQISKERLTLVAGFEFVYASVLLITYILMIFNRIKKKYKVIFSFYIIITTIMLIKASYTTAILMFFIFSLVGLLSKKKQYIIILLFAVILLVFRNEVANLLYYISNWNIWSSVLSIKIKVLGDYIVGNSIEGTSLELRFNLINKSITAFNENILFGVYEKASYRQYIGGHSEWVDLLAIFGLLRTGFLFMYFRSIFKRRNNLSEHKNAILLVVFYIVIISFLNPILYHDIALNIFIIIPFLSTLETKENNDLIKLL